jgi:hypothetical protein
MSGIDLDDRDCTDLEEKKRKAKEKSKLAQNNQWTVDVEIFLHSEADKDFTVESYLQTNPPSKDLVFYNSHHPGFYVNFHLYDETGLGFRFPVSKYKQDGVLSKVGNTPPSSKDFEVFDKTKTDVKDQGATLVAFNPNPSPAQGVFQYTLNVSKDGNPPYLPLDPGGNNMNGTTSFE